MSKVEIAKRFGVLLIVMFIFQDAFSQENYLSGYVVNNNKDTIVGAVDYRNWEINPDEIRFKADDNENLIYYTPTDILSFGVKDEIYVSGIVETEVSPLKSEDMDEDPQMRIELDTTFLQTLIRGEKSLYYYNKGGAKEYFYISNEEGFSLLLYKKYIRFDNGAKKLVESKKYIGQLNLYLEDCPNIYSKLNSISYTGKSIIKLFEYYYKCSNSDIYFQKEVEEIKTEFGVLAGVSASSLKFKSEFFSQLTGADYKPSLNFATGLYFDLILPRNQGRWSIYNELLYTTFTIVGEHPNEETTVKIGLSYLKMMNLIRFKYPIGNMFVFINVGLSNGFSIAEINNSVTRKLPDYFQEETSVSIAIRDVKKYEQGIVIGTGLKKNKFSVETRFEGASGFTNNLHLGSSTRRFYFLVGYTF